jgi:hypothetical protein
LSWSVVLEGQCCYPLSRARERDGGRAARRCGGPGLLRKKASGARGGAQRFIQLFCPTHAMLCEERAAEAKRGRRGGSGGGWVGWWVTLYHQYNIDPTLSHIHSLTQRILSHALSSQACAYCFKERIFSPPVWRAHTHTHSQPHGAPPTH